MVRPAVAQAVGREGEVEQQLVVEALEAVQQLVAHGEQAVGCAAEGQHGGAGAHEGRGGGAWRRAR